MKMLKTKPAKIAMAACAVLTLLVLVFFLQPGPGKGEFPAALPELAQDETTAWAFSQQAQGVQIDVDAVLRQTQAASSDAAAITSAFLPMALPAIQTTQPGFSPTAQAIATTVWEQVGSTAKAIAQSVSTSTIPAMAATTTATAPTTTAQPTQAQLTCTISVRCDTILSKMDQLKPEKKSIVPANGVILQSKTVSFTEGESVFDVLKRVTQSEKIHMAFDNNPLYNSAYVAGIGNLYERDGGELSGWMYRVNGVFPNYGCGRYTLKQGDVVEWLYTCDLGWDIGGGGIAQR